MQWVELSTSVRPETIEEVAALLSRFGRGGATIEERESAVTHEPVSSIKIYLPRTRTYKTIRSEIERTLAGLPYKIVLQERILKPGDWFDSLKQHFGVLEIGEKFIIKPSWICQTIPPSTRTIIELDPGEAFGTGLHPTTRLCLLRLEKHLRPGMAVFDLGTGSGILAIAAAKLGASSVLAIDIDSVAVKVAKGNVQANGVDSNIQVKRGTLSQRLRRENKEKFDLAVANITARTISDLSPGLARILKEGGLLIVSGIQANAADQVLISLAMADFKIEAIDVDGEWHAIIASKTGISNTGTK
jgi:ribosomal protein L11 methyltransferase